MLFLELQNKEQINMAPPQMVRAEIQQTKNKFNQTNMKINSLQNGLGTLGQDLSKAKSKIPRNPEPTLEKLGLAVQKVNLESSLIQWQISFHLGQRLQS
jgi:hypothetical protein